MEQAAAQLEYLGGMEDREGNVESEGTGLEAAPPPSMAGTADPTPI